MQGRRTITVFLASSEELMNDRNSFQALIASLDDIYEERGVRIKCKRWEDFNAFCTGERTQDQYNQVLRTSDMCICMFHRKAGKYTVEEFNHALNEYRQNNDHPKTYVYIRALVEGEVEEEELKAFKADLFQSIGHYWCNYVTDDAMKLHFVMQLERLMTPSLGSADSQSKSLKVEDGSVLLHGRKIADYSNLSFAACNTDYTVLKEKIESLDKEIVQFRAMGIAELQPVILAKSAERNQCYEDLKKLEEQLFSIALSVNKMVSNGMPVSERKRMAIEMFEKGNIRGVIDVLNEKDMSADAERAKAEIVHGKQLIEAGNEMVESGVQKIRSLVEEYTMKAKALMADYTEPDRFQLACQAYEQAVILSREHLEMEELARTLSATTYFLYINNDFKSSEKYCVECLNCYNHLSAANPNAYEPDVAATLNNLAVLYKDTQRFSESEAMFQKALKIQRRLATANPETYEPDVALTLNNLAILYKDTQRFSESETLYQEALEIRRRLAKTNPETYEPDVARTLNNLASLYCDTQRFSESEPMHKEALEIRRRLSTANPEAYEPDAATTLHDLAILYMNTKRFSESEAMFQEALEIEQHLATTNPKVYEPTIATTFNNLAILNYYMQRFSESEAMFQEALKIRRLLAITNPEAYEPDVAATLNNLANLNYNTHRFSESEAMYQEALGIRQRLATANPEANEPDVADTLNNIANLYKNTQRFSESETMYKEALEIRRRLSAANPERYKMEVVQTLKNLASLYCDTQRFSEGELMYLEALEIIRHLAEKNPESYNSDLAKILGSLSFNYVFMQEYVQTERCAREGLAIDSCQTFIYTNLAAALLFQGRYAEAETIYLQYRERLKDSFIEDLELFEKAGVIPKEHENEAKRIKNLLMQTNTNERV